MSDLRKSFKKFQAHHKSEALYDPNVYLFTLDQFVSAWKQAIQNSISKLDPSTSSFAEERDDMNAQIAEDDLDVNGYVADEIIQILIRPHFDQIKFRPKAFFGTMRSYDRMDEKHLFFVQKWKEYILEREASFSKEEEQSDPNFFVYERNLFLSDWLDSAVRDHLLAEMEKKFDHENDTVSSNESSIAFA